MTERDNQRDRQTLAVRAGQDRSQEGEHSDPIFATSSFVFKNAAQAAARFSESEPGNVYSRFTNPTVRAFEKRLAALESASWGIATASGMSAILLLGLALLRSGDHVLSSAQVFGSTVSLFTKILPRFGIEVDFVPVSDTRTWKNALSKKTRLLFLETPSNPLCEIGDIRALAELAHNADSLLVVDNVYCTPALQRPLEMGADVVVHSATKYLDGQGRCVGGALVTNSEKIYESFFHALRTAGPSMSPFNAWLIQRGLATLPIRMEAHEKNAIAVAAFLEQHPSVDAVLYPGLPSHPQHDLAQTQMENYSGMVSVRIARGETMAAKMAKELKVFHYAVSLGHHRSLVYWIGTDELVRSSYQIEGSQLESYRKMAGEGVFRMSIGLEDPEDLCADLDQVLS